MGVRQSRKLSANISLSRRGHPLVMRLPAVVWRIKKHHSAIGKSWKKSLSARLLHGRTTFASASFCRSDVWRAVRDYLACTRVVVESLGHTFQPQTNRAVRFARCLSAERVRLLRNVKPERRCVAARTIGESSGNSV